MTLIDELLEFVDDVVDELGSRQEVEYIQEILRMGTGADRQLEAWQQSNDLKKVVDHIVEETHLGLTERLGAGDRRDGPRAPPGVQRRLHRGEVPAPARRARARGRLPRRLPGERDAHLPRCGGRPAASPRRPARSSRRSCSPEYLESSLRAVPSGALGAGDPGPPAVPADRLRADPGGRAASSCPSSSSSRDSPRSTASNGCSTARCGGPSPAPCPQGWTTYFGGLDAAGYVEKLRQVIVGPEDPESVVLLEIDPDHQKTRVDFVATERLLGIAAVDPRAVAERGRPAGLSERRSAGVGRSPSAASTTG